MYSMGRWNEVRRATHKDNGQLHFHTCENRQNFRNVFEGDVCFWWFCFGMLCASELRYTQTMPMWTHKFWSGRRRKLNKKHVHCCFQNFGNSFTILCTQRLEKGKNVVRTKPDRLTNVHIDAQSHSHSHNCMDVIECAHSHCCIESIHVHVWAKDSIVPPETLRKS